MENGRSDVQLSDRGVVQVPPARVVQVAQLRSALKKVLSDGKPVTVRRRSEVLALLVPIAPTRYWEREELARSVRAALRHAAASFKHPTG